jgi:hypothetical protein
MNYDLMKYVGVLWEHRWRHAALFLLIFFILQVIYISAIGSVSAISWTLLFLVGVLVGDGAVYIIHNLRSKLANSSLRYFSRKRQSSIGLLSESSLGKHTHNLARNIKSKFISSSERKHNFENDGAIVTENGIKVIANSREGAMKLIDTISENGNGPSLWSQHTDDPSRGLQAHFSKQHVHNVVPRLQNDFIPYNLPTGTLQPNISTTASSFIEALSKRDNATLFKHIQNVSGEGDSKLREFLTEVIFSLDEVHRHRLSGNGYVNPEILEITKHLDDKELATLVTILSSGLDFRYGESSVEPKLALLRVAEFIEKKV